MQVAVPASQIYAIDASLTPESMAVDYTKKLAKVWGKDVSIPSPPPTRSTFYN